MEHSLFLLFISGLFTLSSCSSQRYTLVKMDKNWTEAQRHCREHHVDLATIGSSGDMNALLSTIGTNYENTAWIGLKNSDKLKWQWSLANSRFYTGADAEFRFWDVGQPSNGSGNCALMSQSGKWDNKVCEHEARFVCVDTNKKKIKIEFEWDFILLFREYTPNRYSVINLKRSWRSAQSYCRHFHTDLVSITSQDMNEMIREMAPDMEVWIGLFSDTWTWSDNSNSSYRNWRKGQPDNFHGNENCAVVWLTEAERGRWSDRPCDEQQAFVCYDYVQNKSMPATTAAVTGRASAAVSTAKTSTTSVNSSRRTTAERSVSRTVPLLYNSPTSLQTSGNGSRGVSTTVGGNAITPGKQVSSRAYRICLPVVLLPACSLFLSTFHLL